MTDVTQAKDVTETCERCRFYWPHCGTTGDCRKCAPVLDHDGRAQWPCVWRKNWCGEFQPVKLGGDPEPEAIELEAALERMRKDGWSEEAIASWRRIIEGLPKGEARTS